MKRNLWKKGMDNRINRDKWRWLPVRSRIRFKILCIMHRVDNNAAPVYLHKMVKKKVFHRQTRCATTPGSLYEIPSIERKTFSS